MAFCGTADGCLQLWSVANGTCEEVVPVNRQQPLFALVCDPMVGLLAAGKGGRLLWWPGLTRGASCKLELARSLDLSALLGAAVDEGGRPLAYLTGRAPCVRAMAATKHSLTLSTRGGELWELPLPWDAPIRVAPAAYGGGVAAAADGTMSAVAPARLLVQGHSASKRGRWQGEACALAADPTCADAFASGGDDGSVRVWSVAQRRMARMRVRPLPVTALAYSHDGAHIAVGCGGAGIYVLHADDLSDALVFTLPPPLSLAGRAAADAVAADAADAARAYVPASFSVTPFRSSGSRADGVSALGAAAAVGASAIGVLAYSPDDSMLAVGGPGGVIDVLVCGERYQRHVSLVGHCAPVLHLDWSSDGRWLQSACGRCELAFWDTSTGERVAEPGSLRDVAWATWSCPLGLPVQGIYPKLSDGTDILSAHRSPDGRLLVTTDDFRKVNLFRHPAGPGAAACRSAATHAAHVPAARFTADGRHVVTIGGPDLSVMVWRVTGPGGT